MPCPDFSSQSGNRELRLAQGNQIQGNTWGRGLASSIPSAGGGWFFPLSAVNILCAGRNGATATPDLPPVQLPRPGLGVLADSLFQASGPCYTSECIIQTSLPCRGRSWESRTHLPSPNYQLRAAWKHKGVSLSSYLPPALACSAVSHRLRDARRRGAEHEPALPAGGAEGRLPLTLHHA